MAGDWIKMRTDLRDDPAVVLIADRLGIEEDLVVGKLHRLWSWADRHTTDGCAVGVTYKWVDRYVACQGLADAMESAGWLAMDGNKLVLPGFDRHNGVSAKKRCDAVTRQRVSRNGHTSVTKLCDENVTIEKRREEREERREETVRQDSDREPGGLSLFDLSGFSDSDWASIVAMAEAAARRVPPASKGDRRMWLKYAVIAHVNLGEGWLLDAAEGVVRSKQLIANKPARFTAILKAEAEKQGVPDLVEMCKRVNIPAEVWNSTCLKVTQKCTSK